jgi:Flp pilus assembly protein TadD
MNRGRWLQVTRIPIGLLALWIVALSSAAIHAQQTPHSQIPAGASSSVTWSKNIAPILYKDCTTCHHPGGAGPFSLLTYQDATRRGPQIATVTQSRYMPPWLPKPGYGDFRDERRLSEQDIATIARWVREGMPSGDLAAAMPAPKYNNTWQYGTPDLVLTVERPYTLPASGTDAFLEFVLPYPLKQTHYIRAMEIHPGNPQVVHHANIVVDPTASFRHEHPTDWQDGVLGMELDEIDTGTNFDPPGHFLFWKPDTPVLVEPEGMPWKLDPGNDLMLNMHLKPSGKPEVVSAQIGLYFTDKPPTYHPMLVALQHDGALDIPPGDADFVVEDSLRIPVDVQLLGIYPHAHYLGKRMEAWAVLPNQEKKPLILIPKWDIDRQAIYNYRKPILLPAGTIVHMRYVYDNSAKNEHNPHSPPIRVQSGNRSEDEMAHLWLQVLSVNSPPNGPDPRLLLEEAWMRSWLKKDPGNLIPLYNIGSLLDLEGKSKEAIAVDEHTLQLFPGNERILNRLGVALEDSGDFKQAQGVFEQTIAAHPDACDARLNLGRLDFEDNHVSDAEHQFRLMLEYCPPEAVAESGLGVCLAAEGREEAAKTEFQKALQIDPDDLTALYSLGDLAMKENQIREAESFLEAAEQAHPGDIDTRAELAEAYEQSGRLNDATNQLRSAIKMAPANAGLHALLSEVLANSGQLQQAITEEKSALRLEPNDADGWNTLGTEEASAGRAAEARQAFNRALQLDPGNAQARENLQRLPKP